MEMVRESEPLASLRSLITAALPLPAVAVPFAVGTKLPTARPALAKRKSGRRWERPVSEIGLVGEREF